MLRRWLLLCLLLLAAPLAAQEDDRGFLVGMIEDAVSGLGREVRLEGFAGALSSRATVDAITIADDEGVWLRMEDLALQWDRGALLSGRVEIAELSAGRIVLSRLPVPVDTGPDLAAAEATPFALPDLPVSINIGDVTADRIEIDESFLGEPLAATFQGSLALEDGQGTADLRLERIDDKTGRFVIDAGYANATRQLALSLTAEEGPNGIAVRLLNLPGRPAASLTIEGDAPIDDFAARIALATEGEDRVTGDVTVAAQPVEGSLPDRAFSLDIAGDVRPLLADRYDAFFGRRARLALEGVAHGDGRLTLSALTVAAEQLVLRGNAALGTDGWPERFDLRGRLGSGTGAPVTLPVSGDPMTVQSMALELAYDAAQGDGWAGRFDLSGFTRPDVAVDSLLLTGLGTITPGNGAAQGAFTADFLFNAQGVALDDPALAEALGSDATGRLRFTRQEGAPLAIETLTLSGAGIDVAGSGRIDGPDARFRSQGNVTVRADDFARFSALAGRDLSGGGGLTLSGQARPFDGVFDLDVAASVRDLGIDIPQVDPLLAGQVDLTMAVARDETGIRLSALDLTGDHLGASATAEVTGTSATANVDANLRDLSMLAPGLRGSGVLSADVATDADGVIDLDATLNAGGAVATAQATATPQGDGYAVTGDTSLRAADLAPFAGLVGQRLGGGLTVDASGRFETATGAAEATVTARTSNLRVGPAGLDPLLRGNGTVAADLSRSQGGRLRLTGLTARFPNLTADGDLTVTAEGETRADLSLRLADIGLFTPDFSGPVSANVQAVQDAAGWQVTGDATGPAGTSARATGRVGNGGELNLRVTGEAPLGLANVYIAPRQISGLARFDLSVNGPAALRSVAGPVTISGGRLAAPTLAQAIEDINGTVTLGGGTARVAISGNVASGGAVSLSGPVDLFPPFQAGLEATLSGVVLREPTLYRTTADGSIRIGGPLAGGAAITGVIDLGPAEVQVPSSSVSALGELPEVTHLGPRPDVRRTLDRAGVLAQPGTGGGAASGGRPYPLDITIRAPSRIFVRGRGLDAELGGQLQLTGTTADVIPIGQFSLIRGRLDILGQRFELDEGLAQLQGDFVPFLRLVATTEARTGTEVSIILEGPADSPEVRFESSPQLPQDEVLSQLLFGRDLSSISPLQAVQLASAVATLSGRGGGGVLGNIREGLSLDDFDITSDDQGNAAVRAGKYLSDNVYTDITVGSDGTSEINLNLDVTDDITARGSVGSDGETSLGIFYERDY